LALTNEQRIIKGRAQATEGGGHRRLRKANPFCCPHRRLFGKQGIEDSQQIEVEGMQIHAVNIYYAKHLFH